MENLKKNQQILWSSDKLIKDAPSISDRSSNGIDNAMNVHAFLRCRPMNDEEKRIHTPMAISCDENKRKVSVIPATSFQKIERSFIFDEVFGPNSLQKDLFEHVVVPIVNEALEGFICTILAYGQSGTGKTYTMEGQGNINKNGEFDKDVGVIPRAVQQIFDVLESQKAEYSIKVTYLELYNEKITDLLLDENLESFEKNQKRSITLFEDGKGNVYLRGLEEIEVKSANEMYKVLYKGSMKKHTAETFFNENSNRSHSIFSIWIYTKDRFQDGIELLKYGKLNLVDLAGSENIQRSGAGEIHNFNLYYYFIPNNFMKESARGAGMINKSLLTLGRVINALVEHSNHVPYRDSKLTRLLRDSLGGKTKTFLIATISPSIGCLEETLNTLEYAYRSKNIRNRPEVNQRVLRSALIKDLYAEIGHLKKDLHATREKNGIYIPQHQYLHEQAAKKEMLEKIERIELDLDLKEEKMKEIQELCTNQRKLSSDLNERNERIQRDLESTAKALAELEEKYRQANQTIKEKEYLIYNLLGSEKGRTDTAFQLRDELENAASEVSRLLQNIETRNKKEDTNRDVIQDFHAQLLTRLQALHKIVAHSVKKQDQQLKAIEEDAKLYFSEKSKATNQLKARMEDLKAVYDSSLKKSKELAGEINENLQLAYDSIKTEIPNHSESLMDSFRNFASEADVVVDDLQISLNCQNEKIALFVKQLQEAHSRTSCTTHSIFVAVMDLFDGLSTHMSKLEDLAEESQKTDKELSALENKLGEKNSIDGLRGSVVEKSKQLDQEMMNIKEMKTSAEQKMEDLISNMGSQYINHSTIVDHAKDELEECFKHCKKGVEKLLGQWSDAEQCLLCLQRSNFDSIDLVIKKGLKANQMSRARASSLASSTMDEINAARDSLLSSFKFIKGVDEDRMKKCSCSISPCREDLRQMETNHSLGTNEIIQNSEKYLIKEYKVDEPLNVETKKPSLDIPSMEAIEELKTPPLKDLLESFHGDESTEQVNNDVCKPIKFG